MKAFYASALSAHARSQARGPRAGIRGPDLADATARLRQILPLQCKGEIATVASHQAELAKSLDFLSGMLPAQRRRMTQPFTYRSLDVWQLGMSLITDVYRITEQLPRSELYGLTSQLRRAAVSIPSNIAEGHCRRSTPAFANHVSIALGSHGELSTCAEASCNLGFIDQRTSLRIIEKAERIGQMLYRLHDSLEARIAEQSRRR